jgi:ankyrin repeat protein
LLSAPEETEPDDPATLALIRKVVHEPELADRVVAALRLHDWGQMNSTLARHMPEIMEAIQKTDPRLGFALSEVVGRMLCNDDKCQQDCVLEAAAEVVFQAGGSRALLFAIGLGPGTGLKLLLDVAQWACQQGAIEYGCTALWGAGQILQRHYEEHDVLREILLYRVLYLDGPVLGWTVLMINSQLGVAMRYPSDMLLRFVDEAAMERPEVAVAIKHSLGEEPAADQVTYRARLERLASLQTSLGKVTALEMLHAPPEGTSLRLLRQATDLLLPMLDDEALVPAVVGALREIFVSPIGIPQAVHDLVKKRGDDLPEDFRRLYLERVPNCKQLGELPVRYWQSSTREEPLKEAIEAWERGIRLAVDAYQDQQEWARDYERRLQNRTPLMAAATRGDVRQMAELLDQGEDADELNPAGWTAMMFAAEAGREQVVTLLQQRGASVEIRDQQSRSAFTVAAKGGHLTVLACLRNSMGEQEIQQAFREAFQDGRLPIMDWALHQGADPDTLEEEARTPLILASRRGDQPMVARLLAADAYIDHADSSGRTALIYAAQDGHGNLVELLLAKGADHEREDQSGETALSWARRNGHSEVQEVLSKLAKVGS